MFNPAAVSWWVRRRKYAAVLLAVTLAQVAALKALPYSRAWIDLAPLADSELPPESGSFRLGPLEWDVALYSADPRLEPYRDLYRQAAEGRAGLDAAVRVSNVLARRFVHGAPPSDSFTPEYDAEVALRDHLRGAPGHCVTRSSLVATTLLACGIPARVLQVISPGGAGHNILEVWEEGTGWVLYDPTTGASFRAAGSGGPFLSAAGAVRANGAFTTETVGRLPEGGVHLTGFYGRECFGGSLIYPEPWLYTRVGRRLAAWPSNGAFVDVGTPSWGAGTVQRLLKLGIVLGALGSSYAALATDTGVGRQWKVRSRRRAPALGRRGSREIAGRTDFDRNSAAGPPGSAPIARSRKIPPPWRACILL